MKKLFENWRKHLNEIGPSPEHQKTLDRAQRGYEKSMGPPDPPPTPMPEEDAMQDLANEFGVEVMFAKTTDGEHIAIVTFEDGEKIGYVDEEEMYQDLRKRAGY